jgi:hypothetical protein|tara:strand:+ start:2510 stop:2929 length:420 start_codon:yes stop_codon:yes gene_type:complete
MVEDNVKQIKMVNGDELLCEILEELDEDLIIRYCLIIDRLNPSSIDDIKEETHSYYTLRPWMTYIEHHDEVVTLSKYHCMAFTMPHSDLLNQYGLALKKLIELSDEEILDKKISNILEATEEKEENVVSIFEKSKNKLH